MDNNFNSDQYLEISKIVYHQYFRDSKISFEDWYLLEKTDNFYYKEGYYFYNRTFCDETFSNKFESYESFYHYVYLHELAISFCHRLYEKNDFLDKEKYIDMIQSTKIEFSIDDYWLLRTFLFMYRYRVDSNLENLLYIIVERVCNEDFKKVIRSSYWFGEIYPTFLSIQRSIKIRKLIVSIK